MPELHFDPKKVAIAAITSYPQWYSGKLRSIKHTDKVRGDLALEMAQKAIELGYFIVIADGKSTKTFRKALQIIPGIIVIKRKTITSGEGKRVAIERAAKITGVEAIVLTEPEKVSFVAECIADSVHPVLSGKADIVVPKRNDALFKATYPRYMYVSEVEGNGIYNEALRAFKNDKQIVSLFKKKYKFTGISLLEKLYDPDMYSHVLYFPIVNALKKKLRVESREVAFRYPHLQKENEDVGRREEFIAKRSLQRVSILIDLMHFLSFLQKNRNSRIRVL